MRAPRASTTTMKPSATSARYAAARGTQRVLTVIHARPRSSSNTKLVGGSAAPSTAVQNGRTLPSRASANTPPVVSPRSASRKLPSRRSAMPFGRSARGAPAVAAISDDLPLASVAATPPRQSAVYSMPARVASTHSGRTRPWPTKDRDAGVTAGGRESGMAGATHATTYTLTRSTSPRKRVFAGSRGRV
jgi:hypothetical protein